MLFPFLYLGAALSLGISFGSLVSGGFLIPAAALPAALGGAWLAYVRQKNRLASVLALAATLVIGWTSYAWSRADYEKNPVRQFSPEGYCDVSGRLYRSPSFSLGRTYLFLRVEKIRYHGREIRARGNLRIAALHGDVYPSPLSLRAGDRIAASVQIIPARDFQNFGASPLAALRRNQLIHNHAVTKSVLLIEVSRRARASSHLPFFSILRQALQKKIEQHFSNPDRSALSQPGAVLEAMLLGERGRMDEETTAALQRSGLFHLIAISGAHIGIISALFLFVLRGLRVRKRPSYAILIALLLFYSLLVEGRASVFRATIMAVTLLTARLLWRQAHVLNAIAFSAFVLLLSNPFYLFDMGFELTYAATLSIILFYPKILSCLPRLPLKISEMLALSLAAQLGVFPLLAASFNRVTFAALLLNFPAVPLIGVVMAAGFVFLAVSPVSSSLASWLAPGLKLLVSLFLGISGSLDGVPASSYRIPSPPAAVIIGYFLFFLLFLLRPRFPVQRPLTAAFFTLFLAVTVTYPFPPRSSPALRLTFIDVGQGDSILVEFPGRKKMLIDGGGAPEPGFDIGEHVVSPFLWRCGIKKLDYLVMTHGHPDHLNGLLAVARNFPAAEFWEAFSPAKGEAYAKLKESLSKSTHARKAFRGLRVREGPVTIEALGPRLSFPLEREATNDDSLSLRLTSGDRAFLLASDIGIQAEKDILAAGLEVRSQVLKSAHHGSRTSSSEAFLAAVKPVAVIISAGRGNIYGVPHPEVVERFRKTGARVLTTEEDGAIEITAEGASLKIRTSIPRTARD